MGRELRKLAHISVIIIFSGAAILASPAPSEENFYSRIKMLYEDGKRIELEKLSLEFFRRYPRSARIPDVRLMSADLEIIPDAAIGRYRILVDKYRYFEKRDYAHYRICEILYLQSKWDELIAESKKGITLFGSSSRCAAFRMMHARACVYRGRFDDARRSCDELLESHHNYEDLAGVLLLQAYIERKTAGYSRVYIGKLAEIIRGFPLSGAAPAALYLLGRYYADERDYNRAWSALSDVVKKYPNSPEARFARGTLDGIMEFRPVYTEYLPGKKYLEGLDSIDISPEYDVVEKSDGGESGVAYAVSLGPFTDKKSCAEIRELIKNEFSPVETVVVAGRHILYVGIFRDSDSALPSRIRLAEEYGINGNIVRIRRDRTRRYIYGE